MIYDQLVESIYRAKHVPIAGSTSEKDVALGGPAPEPMVGGNVAQDFKEMRIDLRAFRLFLGEMATWARDEYIVSNGFQQRIERKVPEHVTVERLFKWWDTEKKGWLSLQVSLLQLPSLNPSPMLTSLLAQNIITGMDAIMGVEGPLEAIEWLFKLHAATYPGGSSHEASLTQTELLQLSETLLFFFRNEPGDAYLGAVSKLISDAYREGQAVKAQSEVREKQ